MNDDAEGPPAAPPDVPGEDGLQRAYAAARERAARLGNLEDLVWALEEGRGTAEISRRILIDLRGRLDQAHAARVHTEQREQALRLERDRLREQLDALRAGGDPAPAPPQAQALSEQLARQRAEAAAEIKALGGQLGQAARREQELRTELEEKARGELRLRRQLTQLQSQLDGSAPAAAGEQRGAEARGALEALEGALQGALRRADTLEAELQQARQEVAELRAAQAEQRRTHTQLLSSSALALSREELQQALLAARAELDSLRAAQMAEVRALGGQLGQAAMRERDLRRELEEKARAELELRRRLLAAEQRLGVRGS